MSLTNPERIKICPKHRVHAVGKCSTEFPSAVPVVEEFTIEDLRLIRAMCHSANPWFPDKDMYPAWESVYNKAGRMLEHHERS